MSTTWDGVERRVGPRRGIGFRRMRPRVVAAALATELAVPVLVYIMLSVAPWRRVPARAAKLAVADAARRSQANRGCWKKV